MIWFIGGSNYLLNITIATSLDTIPIPKPLPKLFYFHIYFLLLYTPLIPSTVYPILNLTHLNLQADVTHP